MKGRERFFIVLATLLLIAGVRIGRQYYLWYQHAPERDVLVGLEAELEDAGVGVITSQMASDTLQAAIEAADIELSRGRVLLDNLERRAMSGRDNGTYLRELRDFNQRVADRNRMVEDWRETVTKNHRYVERFNLLADSMRAVASRMGEAYYPIRSPAEIATERGLARGG